MACCGRTSCIPREAEALVDPVQQCETKSMHPACDDDEAPSNSSMVSLPATSGGDFKDLKFMADAGLEMNEYLSCNGDGDGQVDEDEELGDDDVETIDVQFITAQCSPPRTLVSSLRPSSSLASVSDLPLPSPGSGGSSFRVTSDSTSSDMQASSTRAGLAPQVEQVATTSRLTAPTVTNSYTNCEEDTRSEPHIQSSAMAIANTTPHWGAEVAAISHWGTEASSPLLIQFVATPTLGGSRMAIGDNMCELPLTTASHWISDASSGPRIQSEATVTNEPVALAVSPWPWVPAMTSDSASLASSASCIQSAASGGGIDPRTRALFLELDRNGDGVVNIREFVIALKRSPELAARLVLPSHIRQEDGTRDTLEEFFQKLDKDGDRVLTLQEFALHFDKEGTSAATVANEPVATVANEPVALAVSSLLGQPAATSNLASIASSATRIQSAASGGGIDPRTRALFLELDRNGDGVVNIREV